jgi:pyruvate dehydrogenase E2 component (dihydrolipoamide acetyltransferase)
MILELLFPAQSPTMTEGTLVSWKVAKNDVVKKGQPLAEVQSDKSVAEWECPENGTIAEILFAAGGMAQVNQVVAILTTKGENPAEAITKAKAKNDKLLAKPAAAEPVAAAATTPAVSAQPAASATVPAASAGAGATLGKGMRVSPVASRIATANQLDLSRVKGSGPDGRIIKRDIEAALANGSARIPSGAGSGKSEKPKLKPFRADGASTTAALSPMRKVIGARLLQAKQQIPHFYITEAVDAAALEALRAQLNLVEGVKISVNDLVVKACALALRMHPKVNATFDGTAITLHDSADISVAVDIPDGLITPIVFKAHQLGVRQISDAVRELAKKARDGKLQPQEFQGGSFTISNLGMFGIEQFDAIINPPQAAILAIAGIRDQPVVRDGVVVPGRMMRITLSADHRVVDGAVGAAFVRSVRELLESPAVLLL